MDENIRWRIAYLLNRLPGQCWADLVEWVLYPRGRRGPWSPIRPGCRADLARGRDCYCGKLRAPEPTVTGGGTDG